MFERLDDEQLAWLAGTGTVLDVEPGWVCREGEPAESFFILLEGTVTLSSRVGPDDVEFVRTDQRGAYGGAFQSYLGERLPLYTTSLRALTPAQFFVLTAEDFSWLMREWFPMAVHLLQGLFYGTLGTQHAIGQRERLLALGSLAAGLSHEPNNPASAIARAAPSLRGRITAMQDSVAAVAAGDHTVAELDGLLRLRSAAAQARTVEHRVGPVESAQREERLTDWMDARGVDGSWDIAPTLVEAGLDSGVLEAAWSPSAGASWGRVLGWLAQTLEAEALAAQIEEATGRISSVVEATKQYTPAGPRAAPARGRERRHRQHARRAGRTGSVRR